MGLVKTLKNKATIRHQGGIVRLRGTRFMAEYNVGRTRRRKSYRTIEAAKNWIEEQEKKLFQQGVNGLRLSSRDTQDATDALTKAQGRVSLEGAVDFWLKHHRQVADSLTVRQTFDRHIAWMRDRNFRMRSVATRTSSLKSFVEQYGDAKLMDLTPRGVEEFILNRVNNNGHPLSPRTSRNLKVEFQAFFNWAEKDRGANTGFENRLMRMEAPVRDAKVNEIIRAADAAQVLHHLEKTHPQTAIASALACFAGLRSEELNQIRWEDIDFDQNEIRVRAEICKTRTSREIPIEPNLLKWLQKYRQKAGPVSPHFNVRGKYRKRACATLNIRWPSNAARHSYGTYYSKHFGSYSQAADNMGHVGGIKMFMSAYKGYCTKEEAAAYWKIEPRKAATRKPSVGKKHNRHQSSP